MHTFWTAVAALPVAVDALHLWEPRATAAFDYRADGFTPKPTAGPQLGSHVFNQIVRRASSTPLTVFAAPDNTCGYIDGLQGAAYTCPTTDICVFYTAEFHQTGSVGCCNTAVCGVRRNCVDSAGFFSSSACTGGCQFDAFTLKCTASTAPFCNTVSIGSGIIDYWCNTVDNSTPQTVLTTFTNETSPRSFTPIVLSATSSFSENFSDNISSGTSNEGPVASPTSSSSSPSSSTSGSSSGNGNGNGNGNSNSNSNGSHSSGSSTPVGPIVGGVVGGVAAIALVGAALWFFLRRRGRSQAASATEASPMQQHSVPPSAYDPNVQSYYGGGGGQPYQQPYGQPPPGGYYPYPSQHTTPDPPTSSASPPISNVSDQRMSHAPTSPGGSFQPQHGAIYEAPTQPSENHRGEMHELASQ